jgi:hypothetical protein
MQPPQQEAALPITERTLAADGADGDPVMMSARRHYFGGLAAMAAGPVPPRQH